MRPALHAEWTKIRTVASPWWLLLGTIAVTVALSAGVTSVLTSGTVGRAGDTTKLSLTGVEGGQALVAILAVLIISSEYSSGMIGTTLLATPRRPAVLAAQRGAPAEARRLDVHEQAADSHAIAGIDNAIGDLAGHAEPEIGLVACSHDADELPARAV